MDFINLDLDNYYIEDLYNIVNTDEFNNQHINRILLEIIHILNLSLININNNNNIDKETLRRYIFDLISVPNGIECCLKIINHCES